jgi:hypothetical protein
MYSVYKQFTAQDIGLVPFNAHKQYTFNSSSVSSNQITSFDGTWSSASIDSFSSGATDHGYFINDYGNSLKYFQLDHLYYKDHKRDLNNKLGYTHYLKHKRELYKNVKVISIPTGLYGYQIKPSTFYLSASNNSDGYLGLGNEQPYFEIEDDSKGNLIIKGTSLTDPTNGDYNTDVRSNILRIGPEKGFKKYDLNTINDEFEAGIWYRRGKKRVNERSSYSTPDIDAGIQLDDSYNFNIINYQNVTFSEVTLNGGAYSSINFDGRSSITIENDEKFNFQRGEDFTINLWAQVDNTNLGPPIYLISKRSTQTVVPSPITGKALPYNPDITGALQPMDVPSSPQFPFEIYVQNNPTSVPCVFFGRSDGNLTTTVSASFTTGSLEHITCRYSASQMDVFINGIASGTSRADGTKHETRNNANLYIGNRGGLKTRKDHIGTYLTGALSQINIYDDPLSNTQVLNHYSSSNGSPYLGNCFYETGIVTITHPNYQSLNFDKLGYNINNVTYITASDISSQEANATDVFFKPDGTKMYISGLDKDGITQYDLSVPWNINTATHVSTLNLNWRTNNTRFEGVHFNHDGTKLYTVGIDPGDFVYEVQLTEPWQAYPAYTGSIVSASVAAQDNTMQGLYFKSDGTSAYLIGSTGDQMYQYTLSTAWDVTTMTHVGTSAVGGSTLGGGSPRGLWFRPDGKAVFVVENTGVTDKIEEYTLSTAWDITTVSSSPSREVTITAQDANPVGVYITSNGDTMFTVGRSNDNVYEYRLGYNSGLSINFQGSHLIYENEYQCTVEEYEYNDTMNVSARYYKHNNCPDLATWATGSLFKPYVTTVGLYNDDGDLLVVGKLGQPVRMSDETDTTFVLRWDS